MYKEFGIKVDEYEDLDEEDAWARDLADRPRLAIQEKEAYREAKLSYKPPPTCAQEERMFKSFATESLTVMDVPCEKISKKELSRFELIENVLKLKLGASNVRSGGHLPDLCIACKAEPTSEPAAVMVHVPIPKYHEISSAKRQLARSTMMPMRIEPQSDKTLKRRLEEVTSPSTRAKQKVAALPRQVNRKRAASPDSVCLNSPLGRPSRRTKVKC